MHWQISAWSFIQAELLHNAGAVLWQHACVEEKQEIASKCRESHLSLCRIRTGCVCNSKVCVCLNIYKLGAWSVLVCVRHLIDQQTCREENKDRQHEEKSKEPEVDTQAQTSTHTHTHTLVMQQCSKSSHAVSERVVPECVSQVAAAALG